jgi:hypothetical protein
MKTKLQKLLPGISLNWSCGICRVDLMEMEKHHEKYDGLWAERLSR